MKINERRTAVCPKCGKIYHEPPAISRDDGSTPICPDCGTMEALISLGVKEEERQKILNMLRAYRKE